MFVARSSGFQSLFAAPPEGGRANRAVEDLLSALTGCACTVTAGHGCPLKTVLVPGGVVDAVREALL